MSECEEREGMLIYSVIFDVLLANEVVEICFSF